MYVLFVFVLHLATVWVMAYMEPEIFLERCTSYSNIQSTDSASSVVCALGSLLSINVLVVS